MTTISAMLPEARLRRQKKYYEQRITELEEVLKHLVEWEVFMGGWENPVWIKARAVLASPQESEATQ